MGAGRILIIVGAVVLVVGVLVSVGLPLGRLPGDIKVSRGSWTFYSPLATGILVSVVLTILLNVLIKR
jgi:hypothetical protein